MRCARALATWLRRQSISCIVSRNQSIRGIITWRQLSQSQVGASGVGRKDTEEFSPFISGELTMQVVVILLGQATIVGNPCFSACLTVSRDFQQGCLPRRVCLASSHNKLMEHIIRLILGSNFCWSRLAIISKEGYVLY